MTLSRDAILKAVDLPTETLDIPEWKGSVRVRTMTGVERDAFDEGIRDKEKGDLTGLKALMAVMSVVDAEGHLIFKPADVDALNGKSAAAIDRIFQVAARLSGLTQEDAEAMVKNSESVPNESSGSG